MANNSPGPAQWLTVPGRLLLIGSLAGAGLIIYFLAANTIRDLPNGVYSLGMWTLPGFLGALIFFAVSSRVLEARGIRIFRRRGR